MTIRTGDLGGLLRARRTSLGLSVREAARRGDISASYLVALEQGRNPTTGRPPVPSPTVLAAISRALEIELSVLLDLTVAARADSVHLLLHQAGAGRHPPLAAARQLFGDEVDAWIEIVDPRHTAADCDGDASDLVLRRVGPLGMPSASQRHDSPQLLAALADLLLDASPLEPRRRLGIVFGANSFRLRSVENPDDLLESEMTWEHDAAARCQAALTTGLSANVCVYREADIQELASRLDPLATVLGLIKAHPLVAAQDDRGVVTTGPAAIEMILTAARPAGTSTATWRTLVQAAAVGLTQDAGATRHEHP